MSTINFKCPHCSHSMQLAASSEGQEGNCPSCGVPTIITASPVPPPATPPVQVPQPPPGYPQVTPQPTNTVHTENPSNDASYIKKFFASLNISGSAERLSVGNERYPNLTKYLAIMDVVIRIAFVVSLVLLVIGVILGMGSGLITAVTSFGRSRTPEYFFMGLGTILGAISVGAIYFLVLLWCRLVAFASLEMIRVFMDNEANTRKLIGK